MIILITGASSTGKTLLSQKILERFSYTYYSVDHIKMGLIRGDLNCGFDISYDDFSIAQLMGPTIEGLIRTALENHQQLALESCYFNVQSIKRLQNQYPQEILCISLVMSQYYCTKHFTDRVLKYRSIIEKRIYEEDRTVEEFIKENEDMKKFAIENGFHVFEVDKDYDLTIENILDFIKEKIGKA
ncbi:hypothetical protein [Spirochaeta cellobiosiphila]|uniref:hypothetical protein n=1 Tax=Spirochaeta cellobiosiphila TaxID=504483 RepID=UPI00069FE60D|nr:hypothetical protein [Spirochaeta cellobiosiphila]